MVLEIIYEGCKIRETSKITRKFTNIVYEGMNYIKKKIFFDEENYFIYILRSYDKDNKKRIKFLKQNYL